MKKQIEICVLVSMVLLVGLSGCLNVVSKEFNTEIEADANTILQVENINGKIEIVGWTGDTITVNADIRSHKGNDELNLMNVEVVEINNIVTVEAEYLGDGPVEVTTDMTIKVPTYIAVDTVSTSNGNVDISGVAGNISAHSSNGAITIDDVDGYISATTSNGQIKIQDTTGIKNIDSSNKEITAELFDFQDNITIETSNGGITIFINPLLNAEIEMQTSNGQISISGISLDLSLSEEKHKIGTLGTGGNTILIQTSNGNINLNKLDV